MGILFVLLIVLGVWLITIYNRLVSLRLRTEEALSDIDVQSKRRFDLVPNLVETVKGYATHEKSLFENVTKARTAAMSAQGFEEKAKADTMLAGTLKSLFAVAENYPQLKANENFLSLQAQLSEIEEKIQSARRFYNGNVRDLNIAVSTFPTNMIAGSFGFQKMEFYDLDATPEARENVKVKF
jgi:LemA protein